MTTGDLVTWRPDKPVTLSCLSVVFAVVGVGVGVASSLVVFGVVSACSTALSFNSLFKPHVALLLQTSPAPISRPRDRQPRRIILPATPSPTGLVQDCAFGSGLAELAKNRGSAWGRFTENIANWFWRIGSTTAEVEVEIG